MASFSLALLFHGSAAAKFGAAALFQYMYFFFARNNEKKNGNTRGDDGIFWFLGIYRYSFIFCGTFCAFVELMFWILDNLTWVGEKWDASRRRSGGIVARMVGFFFLNFVTVNLLDSIHVCPKLIPNLPTCLLSCLPNHSSDDDFLSLSFPNVSCSFRVCVAKKK